VGNSQEALAAAGPSTGVFRDRGRVAGISSGTLDHSGALPVPGAGNMSLRLDIKKPVPPAEGSSGL